VILKNASAIGVAESVSWLIGLGEGKERESRFRIRGLLRISV
jgi:hypothetical protein